MVFYRKTNIQLFFFPMKDKNRMFLFVKISMLDLISLSLFTLFHLFFVFFFSDFYAIWLYHHYLMHWKNIYFTRYRSWFLFILLFIIREENVAFDSCKQNNNNKKRILLTGRALCCKSFFSIIVVSAGKRLLMIAIQRKRKTISSLFALNQCLCSKEEKEKKKMSWHFNYLFHSDEIVMFVCSVHFDVVYPLNRTKDPPIVVH